MRDMAKIARPYALAAFEYAKDHRQLDQWTAMLNAMAIFLEQPELLQRLKNPTYSIQQHTEFCLSLGSDFLDEGARNFIKILAENRRLPALPVIAQLFAELRAASEKTQIVQITSAVPLDKTYLETLNALLQKRFQRNVELHCEVDPALMGGLYIQAGDYVIDGSVRGQLARLREAVIH